MKKKPQKPVDKVCPDWLYQQMRLISANHNYNKGNNTHTHVR